MSTADWDKYAACLGMDADIFFPGSKNGLPQNPREIAETKRQAFKVCASCPVRRQCYESGVRNKEKQGIWGGVLFCGRVRSTCGTVAGHRAHKNRGETPCPACDTARSVYDQNAYLTRRKPRRSAA